jgi:hypothetical protein
MSDSERAKRLALTAKAIKVHRLGGHLPSELLEAAVEELPAIIGFLGAAGPEFLFAKVDLIRHEADFRDYLWHRERGLLCGHGSSASPLPSPGPSDA